MPFELIMLLGFFGPALLILLPAAPARVAEESFRGTRHQRTDGSQRKIARAGRVRVCREAIRRQNPERTAV
jgi:hypothetical protein